MHKIALVSTYERKKIGFWPPQLNWMKKAPKLIFARPKKSISEKKAECISSFSPSMQMNNRFFFFFL